jgi:serine/threonine-protein kinase RsbT
MPLRASEDVVAVRRRVRDLTVRLGFSLVDQTKLVTAASELARNTVVHGRGGRVQVDTVQNESRVGVRLVFEDTGPGIPDIALAMKDGYSTAEGLGLGLGGARRLSDEFELVSAPGEGTRVSIARWTPHRP